MMNLDNYYIHATGGHYGSANKENNIIKIVKTGKIIPVEEGNNYSISPKHQVCLIDPKKSYYADGSAFYMFALYGPAVALSRDIPVIIDQRMHIDEVRHTGEISIGKIQFITFPFYWDSAVYDAETKIQQLQTFRKNIEILSKDFSMIPLKEIYTGKDITLDSVDRQIEVYQKKLK